MMMTRRYAIICDCEQSFRGFATEKKSSSTHRLLLSYKQHAFDSNHSIVDVNCSIRKENAWREIP